MVLYVIESGNKVKEYMHIFHDHQAQICKLFNVNNIQEIQILPTIGHMMELDTTNDKRGFDYNKATGQFTPLWRYNKEKIQIVKTLVAAMEQANAVYVASDDDNEGEAIANEVYTLKQKVEQRSRKQIPSYRVRVNAISIDGINVGMTRKTTNLNAAKLDAAIGRTMLDLDVGLSLTNIVRDYIHNSNIPVNLTTQSGGRDKNYILETLMQRHEEIVNYVERKWYSLRTFVNNVEFNHTKSSNPDDETKNGIVIYPTKEQALAKWQTLAPVFTCSSLSDWDKRHSIGHRAKWPLNTDLNVDQFGGATTVKRIQNLLFQVGLTTYPRTDQRRVDKAFVTKYGPLLTPFYQQLPGNSDLHDAYFSMPPANEMIDLYATNTKSKANEQDAHECYRTLDPLLPQEVVEQKIREGMGQNFNQSVFDYALKYYNSLNLLTIRPMTNAPEYDTANITLTNQGNEFSGKIRQCTKKGYLLINVNTINNDEFNQDLQTVDNDNFEKLYRLFTVGNNYPAENANILDENNPHGLLAQHTTQKKPHFTQNTLANTMKHDGVGRPSTYFTIIEDILNKERGWAILKGSQIWLTDLGMKVAQLNRQATPDFIKKDFTAKMNLDLDDIANMQHNQTSNTLMREVFNLLESPRYAQFHYYYHPNLEMSIKETPYKCPNCNSPLVVYYTNVGTPLLVCQNPDDQAFSQKDGFAFIATLANFDPKDGICPTCHNLPLLKSKNGKLYCPNCIKTQNTQTQLPYSCPYCHAQVVETNDIVKCINSQCPQFNKKYNCAFLFRASDIDRTKPVCSKHNLPYVRNLYKNPESQCLGCLLEQKANAVANAVLSPYFCPACDQQLMDDGTRVYCQNQACSNKKTTGYPYSFGKKNFKQPVTICQTCGKFPVCYSATKNKDYCPYCITHNLGVKQGTFQKTGYKSNSFSNNYKKNWRR